MVCQFSLTKMESGVYEGERLSIESIIEKLYQILYKYYNTCIGFIML